MSSRTWTSSQLRNHIAICSQQITEPSGFCFILDRSQIHQNQKMALNLLRFLYFDIILKVTNEKKHTAGSVFR